jgi:trans-L-3-hydroxyproline dehydratase
LTTLVFDTGLKIPRDGMAQLTFNVPAGRIASHASLLRGRVTEAVFRNVPSFVYLREVVVDVPGIGNLTVDVAYGGAFYVIVDAEAIGLTLTPDQASRLIEFGRLITVAVAARYPMIHPYEADLSFLYGTIFTGRPVTSGHHSRNACIFADG